ncbi:septation protein A [Balneatrix alpica]|uniref:Inner membrane-spanning protein YciB n=1 Tax=Balneatrix alpica TaxID=75684 RepID=A0ABV5ZDZ7_9GAMM|nr:septation protein A [Balneatrix alpica]
MKLLLDFIPILIFFAVYKMTGDILLATAVLIPATLVQMLYSWKTQGKVETMQIVTLVLVILLGGATLVFQDKTFIQWKPTVVNWLFAAGFLIVPLFTKRPVIQQLMGAQLQLPSAVWQRLNLAWMLFFVAMGILNLVVAYQFSEEVWVNFKLFGMLGLTLVFILAQGFYLARHLPSDSQPSQGD